MAVVQAAANWFARKPSSVEDECSSMGSGPDEDTASSHGFWGNKQKNTAVIFWSGALFGLKTTTFLEWNYRLRESAYLFTGMITVLCLAG